MTHTDTKTDKATARPWQVSNNTARDEFKNITVGGNLIGRIMDNAEANAELIVRAVNRDHVFDELVEALADLLSAEECVCEQAELHPGTCSVCTYTRLLTKATDTPS